MNSMTVYSKLVWKGRNLFHFKCSKLTACAGTRKTFHWMQFVTLPGEQNFYDFEEFSITSWLISLLFIGLVWLHGKEELDSNSLVMVGDSEKVIIIND